MEKSEGACLGLREGMEKKKRWEAKERGVGR